MNHMNILKFYGFFYDENRLYLLIEYATRGDLYSHLKRSKGFDEKTVKNYMKQII